MNNIKYQLPYGDTLRDFLTSSGITESDLRSITRQRGIFFQAEEKSSYITLLIKTGITPTELTSLQEKIKTKEENPKTQTQQIECQKPEIKLIEAIPDDYNIHDITSETFSNYEILGSPRFKQVKGKDDCIEMDFNIERYDHTQIWTKNTSTFNGKTRLNKDKGNLNIEINLSHTSKETKKIAEKVSKDLINKLKSLSAIEKDKKIMKITFSDFTNESRVNFLKDLSQFKTKDTTLRFKDTKDIRFIPDNDDELPDDISWMQDKIHNMTLQGRELHETFFVEKKEYHKHIKIHKIESSFIFDNSNYSGICTISFEFPEVTTKDDLNSELQIRVGSFKFKENNNNTTIYKAKEELLSHLESVKLSLYKKHKTSNESTTKTTLSPQEAAEVV